MGSAPDPDTGDPPDISQALKLLATLIARAHRTHLTGAKRDLPDGSRHDPDEVKGNLGDADKEGS